MRRFFVLAPVTLILFISAALPVYAATLPLLDPSFSVVPKECQTCPCDYGGILQLIQNLMNAGVAIGIIAFVVVTTYAGASFMLNPTNPESRTKARSMLLNVVIGMVILLAAWLLVDFVMKVLYDNKNYGPWNSILAAQSGGNCIQARSPGKIPGLLGGIIGGTVNGSQATGSGGTVTGGKCAIRSSGACSVANLTPAFGSDAQTFSKICSHESGGASIGSTVDKTIDTQEPVSFGLFQINISANSIAGYNCPSAFDKTYTSKVHDVHIVNRRLYEECKASALDAATNIQFAAQLHQAHGYSPWLADKECGFP